MRNSYNSLNIVSVIKSKRLRWAGHVAKMEEGGRAFKMLPGKPTGKSASLTCYLEVQSYSIQTRLRSMDFRLVKEPQAKKIGL